MEAMLLTVYNSLKTLTNLTIPFSKSFSKSPTFLDIAYPNILTSLFLKVCVSNMTLIVYQDNVQILISFLDFFFGILCSPAWLCECQVGCCWKYFYFYYIESYFYFSKMYLRSYKKVWTDTTKSNAFYPPWFYWQVPFNFSGLYNLVPGTLRKPRDKIAWISATLHGWLKCRTAVSALARQLIDFHNKGVKEE